MEAREVLSTELAHPRGYKFNQFYSPSLIFASRFEALFPKVRAPSPLVIFVSYLYYRASNR